MVPGSGAARLGFKEMCGMGPQSKMSQRGYYLKSTDPKI